MASSLNHDDVGRLVEALWRLEALQKQRTRDQYLAIVRKELGIPLPLQVAERDFDDLWFLVEGCLEHTGAVHVFLQVVERFHAGNAVFAEIRRLASELLPEPLLEKDERRALHELIKVLQAGDPDATAPEATRERFWTVAEWAGPLTFDTGDIWPVLNRLENCTVDEDGVPPLLSFVEGLAGGTASPVRNPLLGWTDGVARRLGVAPAVLARRELASAARNEAARKEAARNRSAQTLPTEIRAAQNGTAQRSTRSYLVIAFRPDGAQPDRYLTSAWLQSDDDPGAMLHCDDGDPVPMSALPALVVELLTEEPQVVGRPATSKLVLEFVLPLNLLGASSLDQLRITVDDLERRLGIDHPVVVRSLDRMQKQNYHAEWRRKWTWLRENPQAADVCWVTHPGEYQGETLYSMLLSELSSVCLALAFPPSVDGTGGPDELRVALQAGTPIIAWCRRGRSPERFAAEFRELVADGALALPDSVLELRRKAVMAMHRDPDADPLGLELTLLFDDADRFPEAHGRLRAPV
ncbi:hypothetical protein BJF79_29525 [Actinomadura sp. CNU-125]|uniref:VMAP-C domain-containing protein n=1 Tax=Actinomadura sp. CNU-125 TaxID=1904961 RepID=UPI00095A7BF7|nr:MarR family transcriptional regulator [Actinomadura sp. CNU-125]OLT37376.1 hypothetical protein BJF79_29525 [Actinomadura sp. CNU-125]